MEQVAVRKLLLEELTRRRLKNRAYTLRSFAKHLDVSPAAVSEILNGKRRITKKMASRVAARLGLDPEKNDSIIRLFQDSKNRSADRSQKLSTDQFQIVADWYHFAILSLLEIEGAKAEPTWISRRLGISIREATSALERLERLSMLRRDMRGRLRLTGTQFTTTDEISSVALRRSHALDLELAAASLDEDPLELRDFTAITMAIDPNNLPDAKKLIREFRDRLSQFMETGNKRSVYKFCMQLIPLSEEEAHL
jgi:uncharacterized protein (TIGR02147 family)